MRDPDKNNFLFLNREGRWPQFQWRGLELRDDGALQLATVPLFPGRLPDAVRMAPVPDGPAGIAFDSVGTLYFSDPAGNRVMRIDGCDGNIARTPCIGGTDGQPTQFQTPRGLLIPPNRHSLFVADSGNHRIQIFDLDTYQLVAIWGQTNPNAPPQPGSLPAQFNTPWTLTADSAGNVYVVDYGNRRVQKFNTAGDVIPEFWDRSSGSLQQPSDIAVWEQDCVRIFVLDRGSSKIFIFDVDGNSVLDPGGYALSLNRFMGLAVAGDALHVGDNASKRLQRFRMGDGLELIGEAIGYEGPTAALLLDGRGGLWVHPGGALAPVRLECQQGFRMHGTLWGGPIQVDDTKVVWHRLQALAEPLAATAHLELFTYTSSDLQDDPTKDIDPEADNPFSDRRWQPGAPAGRLDVTDLYVGAAEAKYLWVGALFSGDGKATPAVSQLRAEFDHATYDQYLPAIYRNEANCGDFLVRLLSLFESFFGEAEGEIESLPALFDPKAAPKGFLSWLAGWLGLDLDGNWDEQEQRRIIAEIFRMSGERGTAAGLRESLRVFARVDAKIEEPILHAAWWSLPSPPGSCCEPCASSSTSDGQAWQATENSILGWTTMLAPAQPQGAVVGTSAILDQSHLITVDEFGSPLFTDVAYQFSVQVYRGQVMCPETLPRISAILDREKPAHTTYQLCIIEPRLRVGFQSRLGIDTVVGGAPRSVALGTAQALGQETVLAGPAASYLGVESRLGVTTRLD